MPELNSSFITEKQIAVIQRLEYRCDVKFTGSTRREASEFISKYLPVSKQISARNRMVYLMRNGFGDIDVCNEPSECYFDRNWDIE